MASVAILGAGAGGAAAAVDLTSRGNRVALWNRSPQTLAPLVAAGGIHHEGVLGDGFTAIDRITASLPEALVGADVALICLPSLGFDSTADALVGAGAELPLILNPGHTAGALQMAERLAETKPPIAALSTLTYVARKPEGDRVRVTGVARRVRAACLPGGESALDWACELYPAAVRERDVLAAGLANVNFVLHPPAAVLAAAWVEASGGDFAFYADATTPAVARLMAALDAERLAVAAAFGHRLEPLLEEMAMIGTVAGDAARAGDLRAAIAEGEANRTIAAPGALTHRYYTEDFGYGLLPFTVLAQIAGVATPLADALLRIADTFLDDGAVAAGLGRERLGLSGVGLEGLQARVRGSTHTADRGGHEDRRSATSEEER